MFASGSFDFAHRPVFGATKTSALTVMAPVQRPTTSGKNHHIIVYYGKIIHSGCLHGSHHSTGELQYYGCLLHWRWDPLGAADMTLAYPHSVWDWHL